MRHTRRVSNCPFHTGDRVLAAADISGTLAPGTITATREYKTRSTVEGFNETDVQLQVEFDEPTFGRKWLLCDGCQSLGKG
jgi:hypothetical protein